MNKPVRQRNGWYELHRTGVRFEIVSSNTTLEETSKIQDSYFGGGTVRDCVVSAGNLKINILDKDGKVLVKNIRCTQVQSWTGCAEQKNYVTYIKY